MGFSSQPYILARICDISPPPAGNSTSEMDSFPLHAMACLAPGDLLTRLAAISGKNQACSTARACTLVLKAFSTISLLHYSTYILGGV